MLPAKIRRENSSRQLDLNHKFVLEVVEERKGKSSCRKGGITTLTREREAKCTQEQRVSSVRYIITSLSIFKFVYHHRIRKIAPKSKKKKRLLQRRSKREIGSSKTSLLLSSSLTSEIENTGHSDSTFSKLGYVMFIKFNELNRCKDN